MLQVKQRIHDKKMIYCPVKTFLTNITPLFRKKSVLSRDDLQIQWRPLYQLMEGILYSSDEGLGLEWLPS